MHNHHEEFQFATGSILNFVWRGILIGIASGVVVSLFRLFIELIFEQVKSFYHQAQSNPLLLLPIVAISLI